MPGPTKIPVASSTIVAANTAHSSGDGSDHANVATNTAHSTGDGSDHSAVAANTGARSVWVGTAVEKVADYTILATDTGPFEGNGGGAAVNFNLPAVADWVSNNPNLPFLRISATDITNPVTLTPNGAETINGVTGAAAYTYGTAFDSLDLYPVTGGWRIM
jgi:hypothetical protein